MILISSNVSFSQIELVRTFDSQDERDLDCWYAGTNYYELDYGGDMLIYNFSNVNGFITRNIDKENNQLQLSIINNLSFPMNFLNFNSKFFGVVYVNISLS